MTQDMPRRSIAERIIESMRETKPEVASVVVESGVGGPSTSGKTWTTSTSGASGGRIIGTPVTPIPTSSVYPIPTSVPAPGISDTIVKQIQELDKKLQDLSDVVGDFTETLTHQKLIDKLLEQNESLRQELKEWIEFAEEKAKENNQLREELAEIREVTAVKPRKSAVSASVPGSVVYYSSGGSTTSGGWPIRVKRGGVTFDGPETSTDSEGS